MTRRSPGSSFASLPLLLGIGFAILVAISAASVWLVNEVERDAGGVAHTFRIQGKLQGLQRFLRRAESGERGYLLTGDAEDLDVYRTGVAGVEATLADLRSLIADNAAQQAELNALEPILRARLDDMAHIIDRADSQDRESAVAVIRRGRATMEDIGSRVERMRGIEQRLLDARSTALRDTSRYLLFITLAGALLIVGLAAVSVVQTRRSTAALEEAHRALEAANAGLEATVAERTADLREANEESQRFAYIVSHDLRSPLVNIMGFTTELEALRQDVFARLRTARQGAPHAPALVMAASAPQLPGQAANGAAGDEELGEDFDEAIGFIKTSIGKMDRLINAILRLSREGRREFKPERVDMEALIQSIRDGVAHQAAAAEAEVTLGKLPTVLSDRLALEQIFSNLIDNALKYLRRGVPGRVEVEGRATPAGLVYEVRDNGRGIDPKDRERVFDLFRRSGVQDRPGEGIGLAHVRALVRRLGGTITLTSEPGRGSTFTVTLPQRWQGERQGNAA